MAEVLVIAAHPALAHSRVTRALMAALANQAPSQAGARIEVRDLYRLYPDYFIDVAAEQRSLELARLVVWLQPIHWYSMPPLLKLWLDEVFAFGWAYGPGGEALRTKHLWLVASTGGDKDSYHPTGHNRDFFEAYLRPYEQTARLCGMRWLPPMVLHGAHRVADDALAAHAALFVERLNTWPRWPELEDFAPEAACHVPAEARPAPQ